jgi:hypothetical protein
MLYIFKHPTVSEVIETDWADFTDGDGAAYTWNVPVPLTLGAQFVEGTVTRARIDGGVNGALYTCSCTCVVGSNSSTRNFLVLVTSDVAIDMVSVDSIVPRVAISVDHAPESLIRDFIVEAAKEFCERTELWRYTLPSLPLAAGTRYVSLPAPSDSIVHAVSGVVLGANHRPDARRPEAVESCSGLQDGLPSVYANTDTQLVFERAQKDATTLVCRVVLAPALGAQQIPAFLVQRYKQVLADGALSHLLAIANKAWTNYDLSILCRNKFEDGTNRAKVHSVAGRAPAEHRVSFQRLGG